MHVFTWWWIHWATMEAGTKNTEDTDLPEFKAPGSKGQGACMYSSPDCLPTSSSPFSTLNSAHYRALCCTCKLGWRACGKCVLPPLPFPSPFPPFAPLSLSPCWKVRSEFHLLACCKFQRIIVSMKSSNSGRQFQHYNNTGTPPLWAPILPSITPQCPSDTSGISLQRLHPHTRTHTHTDIHIPTHSQTITHKQIHIYEHMCPRWSSVVLFS